MMDQQGQFMELHLWGKGFRGGHVVGNVANFFLVRGLNVFWGVGELVCGWIS